MTKPTRPLSPFLHYRWQYTNALSILHRLTGVYMTMGLMLFVYWLYAVAAGPDNYARAEVLLTGGLIQFGLAVWMWSFFYHFLNGIRHLAWDMGQGFGLKIARVTGWVVVLGSLLLTMAFWVLVIARFSGSME